VASPSPGPRHLPLALCACLLLAAFSIVYLPAVGHGFVKDDFGWVARSRVQSARGALNLVRAPGGGFYRPLVSLSFGMNRWVCGLQPRCYGLTNVALAIGCAWAIFLLAKSLSLPAEAALFASALWMFNWHGINMSVLWISGRTALMVVLLASLAATAFVRGRPWTAALLSFAAMLSKEEAVLLPPVLIAWSVADAAAKRRWRPASYVVQFALGAAAVTVLYFALRGRSGAFTLSTAPAFYQPQFTLTRIMSNGPAYLDRSATFAVAVLLAWLAIVRPRRSEMHPLNWSIVRFGALWFVGALAITVSLPVRSSLYACLPSVGVALVAAAVVAGTSPAISTHVQRRAICAGLALPLLLWPVYYSRNRNSVREADLSAQTIAALQRIASEHGEGTVVHLRDERSHKPSLDNSFGTLVQDAADLTVTPPIKVWIDPPPVDAALAGLQPPSHVDVVLTLRDGRLTGF
jgi:hypothetical protein